MGVQLEALQANEGDCLLLHYGTGAQTGRILIDGGSRGVYAGVLKKRLEELRGAAPRLDLRLVMVSHIDADHITGILDLCKDLVEKQADGEAPRYRIRSLWHNSFEKLASHAAVRESALVGAALGGVVPAGLDRDVAAVVASVKQGNDLRGFARKLTVINAETNAELVMAPAVGKKVIVIDAGLTFTVIGPHQAELARLEASWTEAKKTGGGDEESVAADYLNRTVPNLSSIVVLAESPRPQGAPTRLLLTGDAGGDLILEGLETAGLLDHDGKVHVDLLKVQHHGSNHSVDIEFFRRVTASHYVISGNGRHGIPHGDTLAWLSEARADRVYDVYMTNRRGEPELTGMLDAFLSKEATEQPKHRYHFRDDPALSITVNLT